MKRAKDRIKITRPFAIFVEPGMSDDSTWVAHVVGFELDNVTQGDGPVDAAFMAYDLLAGLTDTCTADEGKDHDYSTETVLSEEHAPTTPAWECTKCGARVAKDTVEDI